MAEANIKPLAELENRIRFETLISDISARFIKLPSSDVDSEIDSALQQILEFFGVDRCGIMRVSEDKQVVNVTHAYYTEGLEEVPKDINLAELFPYAHKILVLKGEPLVVFRASEPFPETNKDRIAWSAMGVKSTLGIPLFSSEGIRYLFSIETVHKEYKWPKEYIPRVTLLGEMFVNALERRDAEYALQESKSRLNLAAESANAGLWNLDIERQVFWSTDKAREIFGFQPGTEISLEDFLGTVHPDDRCRLRQTVEEAAQSTQETNTQYRIIRPDGQVRWIASRGRTHLASDGHPDGFMGVSVDITEQKKLRDQVSHASEQWQQTFDAIQDVIMVLDCDCKIIRVNATAEMFFGQKAENIVGHRCHVLINGTDTPLADCPVQKALCSKRHEECENYLKDKDRWFLLSADPIIDENGRLSGFIGVLKDITERKKNEQKLLGSREILRGYTSRLLTIQEEERRRLARELHDDFTQRLAVLSMDLSKAETAARMTNSAFAVNLSQIRDQIVTLSADIHDLSRQLHPSIIEDLGLGRALQSECTKFTRRTGIDIRYTQNEIPAIIPQEISMVLFRVTQEALRNIQKHAGVQEAEVCLAVDDNGLILTIQDAGTGFDPQKPQSAHGLGLFSMEERVQLVHGVFSIDSMPERGTTINATVPLTKE